MLQTPLCVTPLCDVGFFPVMQWRRAQNIRDLATSPLWMQGLMWPWEPLKSDSGPTVDESRWLRHEDWEQANSWASIKQQQ